MDIYIEEVGGGNFHEFYRLYAVQDSCLPGHGIMYNSSGKPYEFAWCDSTRAHKLPNDLKQKFEYSFTHGSHNIEIPLNELKKSSLFKVLSDNTRFKYNWIKRK